MSKYLTIFNTEAQWQAAQDTLDYPNVSLIDTTGDLHYSKYIGQEVANAPFGSILMANVATNKLFYIEDSADYNLTDYPLESYKPIAVCIYDKASNANNETVFMSVQWMDRSHLGQGSASRVNATGWGFNGTGVYNTFPNITYNATNYTTSRIINSEMKTIVTMDYSGTSIQNNTGNGQAPAFCVCWRYKTIGTNEGDWMLPTAYDLSKYKDNRSTITTVLTNIKTVAGSSYLNDIDYASFRQWTANEATY